MRPLLIGVAAIAVLVLVIALALPQQFQSLSTGETAHLIWLLLAALLVGGGAFGINRFQGGGNLLIAAAFWAAMIAGVVVAYQAFDR